MRVSEYLTTSQSLHYHDIVKSQYQPFLNNTKLQDNKHFIVSLEQMNIYIIPMDISFVKYALSKLFQQWKTKSKELFNHIFFMHSQMPIKAIIINNIV